jgi:hypothetical protein
MDREKKKGMAVQLRNWSNTTSARWSRSTPMIRHLDSVCPWYDLRKTVFCLCGLLPSPHYKHHDKKRYQKNPKRRIAYNKQIVYKYLFSPP